MAESKDELFIGWAPALPRAEARMVRRALLVLVGLALAVPLIVVLAQTRLAPASFEYGVARRFAGTIHADPVPTLTIARPAAPAGSAAATSTLLLVAPGKHGAAELARAHDGEAVEVTGTLVYREGRTMLEVEPGTIVARDPAGSATSAAASAVDLGDVRLAGEIVDTKCHLGVMNPGDGKTHRACAARCISGGVPPALRVTGASGESHLFLLVGPRGESIAPALLPFVAEPVEITGRAERRGDLLVLYADPAAVRRIGEEG